MKKLSFVFVVLISVLFGCAGSAPSSNIDFYNSPSKLGEDAAFGFYAFQTVGTIRDVDGKLTASIRGNELNLIAPESSSSSFQYAFIDILMDMDNKENYKSANHLRLVNSIGKGGGYTFEGAFGYVNKAGSAFILFRRFTFPKEGWYLVYNGGVWPLTPPDYTLPPGFYWVVYSNEEADVVWWKQ